MDASQKLRHRLDFEQSVKDGLVRDKHNPIWDYKDTLLDGPVIDIGCGQSDILLSFAATDRTLIALDAEPLQLEWLKQLAQIQPNVQMMNWQFIEGYFPETPLPAYQYALISFSNLLHFLPWEECVTAIANLAPRMVPGTQVYVKVHSDSHEQNKVENPAERYNYFKHFFAAQEVTQLFPQEHFEHLYLTEVDSPYTKEEELSNERWVREWYRQQGETDATFIERQVIAQNAGRHNHIVALVRKR